MERDKLLEKLTSFLNEAMMGRADGVKPDDSLSKLGLDSMGTMARTRLACRRVSTFVGDGDRGGQVDELDSGAGS